MSIERGRVVENGRRGAERYVSFNERPRSAVAADEDCGYKAPE